jgi:hypothetical protein
MRWREPHVQLLGLACHDLNVRQKYVPSDRDWYRVPVALCADRGTDSSAKLPEEAVAGVRRGVMTAVGGSKLIKSEVFWWVGQK